MLNGFQNHFFILLNFIAKHVILGSSKNGTERDWLSPSVYGGWRKKEMCMVKIIFRGGVVGLRV